MLKVIGGPEAATTVSLTPPAGTDRGDARSEPDRDECPGAELCLT